MIANPNVKEKYEVSKRILNNVKKYFEENLSVESLDTLKTDFSVNCNELVIPPMSSSIDLYIGIKAEDDINKEYFAAATQCLLSSYDRRPVMGIYYLNFVSMSTLPVKEYLYFSTFAHEFTHILGFSKNLFNTFVNADKTTREPNEIMSSK